DAPAGDGRGHELHHALLDHRRAAGRDQVELGLVDVHADDAMPVACEAGERDGADVTETEDADIHARARSSLPDRYRAFEDRTRSMIPSRRRIDCSQPWCESIRARPAVARRLRSAASSTTRRIAAAYSSG